MHDLVYQIMHELFGVLTAQCFSLKKEPSFLKSLVARTPNGYVFSMKGTHVSFFQKSAFLRLLSNMQTRSGNVCFKNRQFFLKQTLAIDSKLISDQTVLEFTTLHCVQ